MRRMLDRSRLLAGKTDPENSNLWLPLWMHLRDTAEIMELLVRKWLPDSVKKASGLEEEELVQLARFLGWGHDLGKAILIFQSTIMQCLPEAKQRLERLTPLSCQKLNRCETPHARASEAILRNWGALTGSLRSRVPIMASRRTAQKLTNSLHAGKSTTTRKSKRASGRAFGTNCFRRHCRTAAIPG